jgi:DNA-directed RNA polymerase specialized sigma24 family protein
MLNETELSSELEWMLGSGQATPAMLAEVLIERFFTPAYQLSLAILGDGQAATAAVQIALVSAVSRAPRYQQTASPQVWFFQAVLEAIQEIRKAGTPPTLWRSLESGAGGKFLPEAHRLLAALDQEARLPALFAFLLGWETSEIAPVLRQASEEISATLERARRKLTQMIPLGEDPVAALQAALPAPSLSHNQIRESAAQAASQAEQQGRRNLKLVRVREFSWLIAATVLVLVIGLAWSSWQQAMEPSQTPPPPLNTPTPHFWWQSSVPYYTRPGDTLKSIAGQMGLSLEDLVQLNPGISNGPLPRGHLIQLPARTGMDSAPPGG